MRPPMAICWSALFAMLPQLTGCRSFYPVKGPLPASPATADLEKVYRVTFTDGSSVVLSDLWTDSVRVGGAVVEERSGQIRQEIEAPMEDVEVIEEKRLSMPKTLAVTAVYAAVSWGLFVLLVHSILEAAFDDLTLPTGG